MTKTVYMILKWTGSAWEPLEEESDRLSSYQGTLRQDAEKALAEYLAWSQDDPKRFMLWEARGYPALGPQ